MEINPNNNINLAQGQPANLQDQLTNLQANDPGLDFTIPTLVRQRGVQHVAAVVNVIIALPQPPAQQNGN